MSSDGVLDNDNHGLFFHFNITGSCYALGGGMNGGQFVKITSAMTSTPISSLTFNITGSSSLCGMAGGENTWHIFKTIATTPNTIWAAKLDGSRNFPATLDATNFQQCNPAGNFDTANGCSSTYNIFSPPAVNAPIDLHFSKQVEIFATEIEVK